MSEENISTERPVEMLLLPCPFCGSEPRVSTYATESLWSHDQVTYTKIECPECEIAFNSEPGYEVEAPDAWNSRSFNKGEVVAWQRRHPTQGWQLVSEEDIPHYVSVGQEVRPLYA